MIEVLYSAGDGTTLQDRWNCDGWTQTLPGGHAVVKLKDETGKTLGEVNYGQVIRVSRGDISHLLLK